MRLIKPTNENLIIKKINKTNFFGFCPKRGLVFKNPFCLWASWYVCCKLIDQFQCCLQTYSQTFCKTPFCSEDFKTDIFTKISNLNFFTISVVCSPYHGVGSEKVIITGLNKTFLSHFTITVFKNTVSVYLKKYLLVLFGWRSYHFVACKGF